jgi:putative toxin-antitoxin system antitoxin component (TIGR02293 family)
MANIIVPIGKVFNMAKSLQSKDSADIVAFRQSARDKERESNFYLALLGWRRQLETAQLFEKVRIGFSYKALERFQSNISLSNEALSELVQIKKRTLARRKETGRLTSNESDRLLRVARVFGKVLALFDGDIDAARTWFSTPAPALDNRSPRDLSNTELGSREVAKLVGRLEHGVFS